MPRPVEALPCGSRSTMSTRSSMAASAVPRLIAVVVLPTPPFWLASTSTLIDWARGTINGLRRAPPPGREGGANRRARRLGTVSIRNLRSRSEPVNSAAGAFPLRKHAHRRLPRGIAVRKPRACGSGASARAETASTGSACVGTNASMRSAWIVAGAPVSRATVRRKAALRLSLSTRCTEAPGSSASRMAVTRPGKPPPEPRSTQRRAAGAAAWTWRESPI